MSSLLILLSIFRSRRNIPQESAVPGRWPCSAATAHLSFFSISSSG
jgi:hypothetical protein